MSVTRSPLTSHNHSYYKGNEEVRETGRKDFLSLCLGLILLLLFNDFTGKEMSWDKVNVSSLQAQIDGLGR